MGQTGDPPGIGSLGREAAPNQARPPVSGRIGSRRPPRPPSALGAADPVGGHPPSHGASGDSAGRPFAPQDGKSGPEVSVERAWLTALQDHNG